MYLAEKNWDEMIGGSEDSMTLGEYLADKGKRKISLKEIFEDFGFNDPGMDFKTGEEPITVTFKSGIEPEIYYAIDVMIDLAGILLECKVNGKIDLSEFLGMDLDMDDSNITVTSSAAEEELMKNVLTDFSEDPMGFSLSEMCEEDEMQELSDLCRELLKELFA